MSNLTQEQIIRIDGICCQVRSEVIRAMEKHPPMPSPHHGYAVIKEELDGLWEDVKADFGRGGSAMAEAVQIGAMAVRYIMDLEEKTP